MATDFSAITELPGAEATGPQLQRIVQRYELAARHAAGRRVLEVACGAGLGLGWLQSVSTRVVGGDYTRRLLGAAQAHYQGRVPLLQLDAQQLPFADAAFDLVVIFEAIYYLADLDRFLREARRVLAPGGLLIVSSVNPEWPGHSPSSFSTHYPSLSQLAAAVERAGFTVAETYGGFPTTAGTARDRVVDTARALAARLHLIPNTLAARAFLKRVVYGGATQMPPEVSLATSAAPPLDAVSPGTVNPVHQIVYLVARSS